MGLRKLQETFMTERVTGEILLECDDEVLYQELKVNHLLKGYPQVFFGLKNFAIQWLINTCTYCCSYDKVFISVHVLDIKGLQQVCA